ncbi:uncharacterized protein SPSK_03318 [Sporothrix schenckii 1099-18]|uniref:BZIP domain-containing protein n=1 Tax=Sporothrix schenckii 1099-18 TaxID=1397361 RepID=A0A0F2M2H1_SPOSC|nr:uncharacterized protein SPSK_03318 [Sporothrix schenckii 1099-18]KJR82336.1 hypothetical protein SPSK_03318 [Sporothrix schenckii 1099-18]
MSRSAQGWTAVPAKEDVPPAVSASRPAKSAQSATSTSSSSAAPKTRQRIHKPPEPLNVPDIEEDAAERKRVLNVLAQRRYRERRRQKKAAKAGAAEQPPEVPVGDAEMTDAHVVDLTAIDPALTGSSSNDSSPDVDEAAAFMDLPAASSAGFIEDTVTSCPLADLDLSAESMALAPFEFDLSLSTSLATMAAARAAETGSWGMGTGAVILDEAAEGEHNNAIVTTSSASAPSATQMTVVNPLLTFGTTANSAFTDLSSVSLCSSSYGISSSSNSSVTDPLSPTSYYIPVTELTLLRAVMRISARLGCTEEMWQIDGQSPFVENRKPKKSSGPDANTETCLSPRNNEDSLALLPPNWRPTRVQRAVPHHPALDVLPWPSVREKLIGLFNMPLDERPPIAADPLALVHLIYDLEDSAEGLRIWGSDPYDPTSWEVGQLVFERWWFVFDRDIIEQSNRWRQLRGASRLRPVRTDTRTKGVMDMIWA